MRQADRLVLFPVDTRINEAGHLEIGGCDACDLAAEFGTPLYVFDEATLKSKINEFKNEFRNRYPETTVLYACKAFINRTLLKLLAGEGIGLDVVSGGEISIAAEFGFPMDRVSFPGSNKSGAELRQALEYGVGRIVIDNFDEIALLRKLVDAAGKQANVLIRVSPGIDPHTHEYESTGNVDSKFGFPLAQAEEALLAVKTVPQLKLMGLHFHVGSQLTAVDPYREAIEVVLDFAVRMKEEHDFVMRELSVGGGFPVQMTVNSPVPPLSAFAQTITASINSQCQQAGLPSPRLVIEPGRSLVAQAGVALYTAGTRKDIPGVRTYISVDGGMADNIRPALYQDRMEAILANKAGEETARRYTIAGRFCESGDILIQDIEMPEIKPGDILAVPGNGAYNIPQSCNYNAFLRPAVIMVKYGRADLIRRRETIDDLIRCDTE